MSDVEVYVLTQKRSSVVATAFLDAFIPCRQQSVESYPVPAYSDVPLYQFSQCNEILAYLEENVSTSYTLYWDNLSDENVKQAMLFYTVDGMMIAGLAGREIETFHALNDIARIVGGEFGYVSNGEFPPQNRQDFVALCLDAECDRLVYGRVVSARGGSTS